MAVHISRRRLITISAATALLPLLPYAGVPFVGTATAAYPGFKKWRGIAMGAEASLTLNSSSEAQSQKAINAAMDEISRLEKIFSLFINNSALSTLNREGSLKMPPLDLVICLAEARRVSLVTKGAFDASVQPLWQLYANHFADPDADPRGPKKSDIAEVRALVDFNNIDISTDEIVLTKPGMALTLNGIAQGYITDKVTELLKSHGFNHVLINMGETRALGNKGNGQPWQVAINKTNVVLPLVDQALATSGGYGTPFEVSGKHHHLFDPSSGHSTNRWSSVSVIAPTATLADAQSTAFTVLPEQQILQIAAVLKVSVYAFDGAYRPVISPPRV